MELFIFSGLTLTGIGLTLLLWILQKPATCLIALGITLGFVVSLFIISPTPTAMDVYRGKTTLEYKVVDGIVMDSCVIYKIE